MVVDHSLGVASRSLVVADRTPVVADRTPVVADHIPKVDNHHHRAIVEHNHLEASCQANHTSQVEQTPQVVVPESNDQCAQLFRQL